MTPAHRGGPQIACISGPPHSVIHARTTNPCPRQMPGTGKTPVSNAFATIIAEGILGNAWFWSSAAYAVTIGRCHALEQPLLHQCLRRLQRQQRELRPRRRQGRLQQAVGSAHARRQQPNKERDSWGTTSREPRPLLYHHLDKIEGLHQPIPVSKIREDADCAATQVCVGRATALIRRKLAHPRGLRVEKFNGATAVALEKRCISQPIARETNPGNPLLSRQPRHSTV